MTTGTEQPRRNMPSQGNIMVNDNDQRAVSGNVNITTIKASLFALAIAVSVMAIDLSMPLGVAGGVLYIALVLTGWWFRSRSAFLILAVVASLLTIVGFFLSPEGSVEWVVVTNRFYALVTIWVTAAISWFSFKHTSAAQLSIKDYFRWSVTVGAVIPLLVLGVLLLTYNKGPGMSGYHTSLLLTNTDMLVELSQSHLMLEEWIEGDRTITPEDVWQSLESATILNQSLMVGPQQSGWLTPAHNLEGLGLLVRRSEKLLEALKLVGEERVANPSTGFAGSPLDQDFDSLHLQLLDNAKLIETKIKADIERNSEQLRFLIITLSCGVVFFSIAASLALRKFEAQRLATASKLEDGERRYRTLFNNMGSSVAIYTAVDDGQDFVFTDINRAGEKTESLNRNDLLGRRVTEAFPAVSEFGLLDVFKRVWHTGKSEHHPISVYTDERIAGWRENYVYKLPTGEIVAVYEDVTEQKRAEEEAQLATEKAEIASQAKSEFLASMSHELRTPLNAILGFAQILQSDTRRPLSASQADQLGYILEGGDHLLGLINQVLDLSHIESDQVDLVYEAVSINTTIGECVAMTTPLSDEQGITVINELADGPSLFVHADALRLKQIIINLLSNALKYNKPGGTVTISGQSLRDERVVISVSDTGIGIADEDKESVYLMFHRLGDIADRTSEGTGIGLNVTKLLVEKMGGTISFESQEGVGTTFTVDFPSASAPKVSSSSEDLNPG